MVDGASRCPVFGISVPLSLPVSRLRNVLAYSKACKVAIAKKVSRIRNFTLPQIPNFPFFPVFIHEYLPNGRRWKSGLCSIKSVVKFWTRIISSRIFTGLSGFNFKIDISRNRTTWVGDRLLRTHIFKTNRKPRNWIQRFRISRNFLC
jgi:hypothetical protein